MGRTEAASASARFAMSPSVAVDLLKRTAATSAFPDV
jgi:hypothetical protein